MKHDEIILPNGRTGIREYVVHKGAACVVPLTDDGCVLTVSQHRYPLKEVLTDIPAGKRDSVNEPPLEAAERELKEKNRGIGG